LAVSAIPLLVQIAAASSPDYGYFIDELYYLACARRLAAGYVDHPPLAPLLLAIVQSVLGDSRMAIRIVSFLAGGATVALGGILAVELGGGLFAMTLASLSIGLAPGMLALSSFFSMNAFEPLIWTLVGIRREARPSGADCAGARQDVAHSSTPRRSHRVGIIRQRHRARLQQPA
jgi:hypothetical protein